MQTNFAVTKTIKEKPFVSLFLKRNKRLFPKMKNVVLGTKYNLSLTFIGEKRIRSLNKTYRGKNRATDILSFPLSKNEGEIFINFDRAKVEAKKFSREMTNFILFLFIHGLCHLKGMRHGSTMEGEERKYRKRFNI